jgi:hypothetical protein
MNVKEFIGDRPLTFLLPRAGEGKDEGEGAFTLTSIRSVKGGRGGREANIERLTPMILSSGAETQVWVTA